MPLPGDLTTTTVTGQFTSASGQPITGKVTFCPTSTLLDPTSSMVIPAAGAAYPLSASGSFQSDPLIATDNADLEPQGWAYTVLVELQDLAPYTFQCFLPSSPSTVDISALEPVFPAGQLGPAVTGGGNYLPAGGGTETGTLVLDATPPLKVPGSASGYVLVSDGSGNYTPQPNAAGNADSIDGLPISGTIADGRTIIVGSGGTAAVWQLPLQLDFTNGDISALGPVALASSSAGLSGPPGRTQAAVVDHVHPYTGVAQTASNLSDLASESAARTNLGLGAAALLGTPIPVADGGTGSGTQNFVDLTTNQAIAGVKTFSGEVIVPSPPQNPGDAVPKSYADAISSGLTSKFAAVAATVGTESFTISAGTVTTISGTTLDGVSPNVNDQVLIKDANSSSGTGLAGSSEPANGLYCLSVDTEILTEEGWKLPGQLRGDETVLTVNVGSGLAEWQPLKGVHVFDVTDEPLLAMEGPAHSSLSTLDHRWVVREGSRKQLKIRRSHDLRTYSGILRSAPCSTLPSEAKYSDALVELIGWFITEGHIRPLSSGKQGRNVRIVQSATVNAPYVARIRSALTGLFGAPSAELGRYIREPRWTECPNSNKYWLTRFDLNAEAGSVLIEHAPDRIVRPEFIAALTRSQLTLFVDTCIAADGAPFSAGSTRGIAQKNPRRLDAIEMAAILLGFNVNRIAVKGDGGAVGMTALHIGHSRQTVQPLVGRGRKSRYRSGVVKFSGQVWCPETPNGTWVARRRGTVFFTGNTVTANVTNLSVSRVSGMSGANSPAGAFVFIESGTANKGAGYVVTTPAGSGSFTYGSGSIQFTQFSSAGSVSVTAPLTQTGSVLGLATPLPIADGGTGTGTGAPQNDVFAGPASGGSGTPSFRALAVADLPAAGGDVTGTLTATTVAKIQGVSVTSAEATLVSDLNNATARTATATLLPGEETVFSGSTASQTLTLPTSPPSSSVNTVTNAASVSVTLAAGAGTTLSNFGTSGSVTIPAGYTFAVVCIGSTWYVQSAGPADFAKSSALSIANGGTGATSAAAAITALGAADLTSAQTLTTKTLKNTSLTFDQLGTVTTSQSLSCANGNVQELTLGASVAVSAVTGPGGTVACDLTIYIKQASSGGPYTITSWPSSITWLGGSAPTIQTAASAVTVLTFESLNGGTNWYGAQITGAPALPLTIALGGTGAADSNDALAALAGQGVLSIFGNGNDGTIVFDGTTAFTGFSSLSGSTYTLTRDVQGASITVNSGVTVRTSSGASGTYRIFCQGTVTINSGGTVTASGNAAGTAPTAGAVLSSGSLVGGRAGGAGGAATPTAGTAGGGAEIGATGGAGGAGGGGGGLGGAGGTVVQAATGLVANAFNTPFPLLTGLCFYGGSTLQIGFGAGGGGGGGATGDAGGGGGGGGGIVAIFAYSVINNGTITAAGGAGAQGAGGNAGGGGGGAGGLIIAYTLSGWTAGTTVVTGGAGGALSGSGTVGSAGGSGNVVNVVLTS